MTKLNRILVCAVYIMFNIYFIQIYAQYFVKLCFSHGILKQK